MNEIAATRVRASEADRWTARSVDFGGSGEPLHVLHANGYPPACYTPLIERLRQQQHVFGMTLRPLWADQDPNAMHDWRPFSEDLRDFLHAAGTGPVIGMGHSIGAVVTLRAALWEPGLFSALVLIDPVLLPPSRIMQLRVLRAVGLLNRLNRHTAGALRRRRHFDSREQMFAGYRRRDIFRFVSDDGLRDLVEGLTRPSAEGGYDLVYSPEWEARIYQTAIWNDRDLWNGLPRLGVPTLIIRGAQTDTFWAQTARLVQQRNPAVKTVTIPAATHLVPLERPDEVAQETRRFLEMIHHR